MTVKIDGQSLKIEDVVKVARRNELIGLEKEAEEKIVRSRDVVEKLIAKKEKLYGISTGIGELSNVLLSPDKLKEFQKYVVYSHAAGWGEPVAMDDARAAWLTRVNVLSKGYSGLRLVIVKTLIDMLNKGVTPVMCSKGSVGASGDLSPLGQGSLVLIGEGEAFFQGERMTGKQAMDKARIQTVTFEARDGLATINGSNLVAGMGCLQVSDAEMLIKTSEIAAAMTLEALTPNMLAFDERIHKARGYDGAVECAENIRRIVQSSDILKQKPQKVQESYSLRSTPQVVGAAKDTLKFARRIFETEINGACDNPLFFTDEGGICLTGANFQGTPLAFALEYLGIALTTVGALSERRMNRLVNPVLNMGLPAFLTKGAGMFSGMMLAQYTAASLVCENRVLSTPAATGSIPTAADQEDFVSMANTTAMKTKEILKNSSAIFAIELMAGAQALDFRKPLTPGKGTQAAYDEIRKSVTYLDADRPLYPDITRLSRVVESGEILGAVENAVGKLR
ncbi:MAG TPA: histidine ammonia-lyase [Candidatus Acidoferrales bacterium]|nr:histidine ammonia-lyase [Candidatus Acidoferrales bacterium]